MCLLSNSQVSPSESVAGLVVGFLRSPTYNIIIPTYTYAYINKYMYMYIYIRERVERYQKTRYDTTHSYT